MNRHHDTAPADVQRFRDAIAEVDPEMLTEIFRQEIRKSVAPRLW